MNDTPLLEIRHPRGRAAKQLVFVFLAVLVGAAMAWFGVWLARTGGVLIIVIGGVLALLGGICVVVCLIVAWMNLKVLLGRDEPALVVDGDALRWQGVTFPWSDVIGLVAESEESISFAGGADVALDRSVERAMAAAGVNDGTRELVVHLRDRAASAAAAGKADYLVQAGPEPGTGSVRFVLGAVVDQRTFDTAVHTLATEARRRGVPFQVVNTR